MVTIANQTSKYLESFREWCSMSFFWLFDSLSEERTGKRGAERERQRHAAKCRRSDSNPSRPLSAVWHVVARSMHWAKSAPMLQYVLTVVTHVVVAEQDRRFVCLKGCAQRSCWTVYSGSRKVSCTSGYRALKTQVCLYDANILWLQNDESVFI